MQGQGGFTLFELIITMAIAAIVFGWAAPTFSTMIQDNRISGQSLDFITSLNLARSEAIKRSTPVTLCKSANGQDCVVDGGTTDWGQGWIVFTDNNGNQTRDNGEPILRVHGSLAGNNRLTGNQNVDDAITYTTRGSTTQFGTLSLCDPRKDNTIGKAIRINITGRAKISSVAQAKSDGLAAKDCT